MKAGLLLAITIATTTAVAEPNEDPDTCASAVEKPRIESPPSGENQMFEYL